MTKEAYVSFEIAKLLKEKGFDESTFLVWYEHLPSPNAVRNSEIGKPKRAFIGKEGERNSPWTNNSPVPSYISGEIYSCPTHQMACAWLREKNIGIVPEIHTTQDPKDYYWGACIFRLDKPWNLLQYVTVPSKSVIDGYDEVIEQALKYSLENLI